MEHFQPSLPVIVKKFYAQVEAKGSLDLPLAGNARSATRSGEKLADYVAMDNFSQSPFWRIA
jgi:hypothetical protein